MGLGALQAVAEGVACGRAGKRLDLVPVHLETFAGGGRPREATRIRIAVAVAIA
jgi:hypothetical protein